MTHEENQQYRAQLRQTIAERQNGMLAAAIEACGPDATAYGVHTIHDRTGLEPDRHVYCCRRPTHAGWQPKAELPPGLMPVGPWASPTDAYGVPMKYKVPDDETRTYRTETRHLPVPRYYQTWAYLEEYKPKEQWQLDEAQAKRQAKALEREAQDNPLFADQIRDEGTRRRGTRDRAR